MSFRLGACKKCFFGVCIFLRLDGPLPTVSGDILAVLGTSGKISFMKDVVYKFLEVFGKNNNNNKFHRKPSRHRNGYGKGKKIL